MKNQVVPLYTQTYIDAGSGVPVLLLHGLFGELGIWKPIVEALKDNYRVIVPRLPIFDLPVEHTNVKAIALGLREFIEWHDLKEVVLVGHAMGGQVALQYTRLFPTTVKKIILTASSGIFETTPYENAPYETLDRQYVVDKVSSAFADNRPAPDYLVEEIFETIQNIPKRLTIDTLTRSSKHVNVGSFLNKIDHPVLLIWGLDDRITPPDVALHFQDYLQNAEVKFIKGSGHLPMLEKTGEFVDHVRQFLMYGTRKVHRHQLTSRIGNSC